MKAESVEAEPRNITATELNHKEWAGRFPLSFAQEGLWFVEQIAPGTPCYNMPEAWRLEGELNIRALESAIEKVIHRHEALRTVFPSDSGKAVQAIRPPSKFRLVVRDLSECVGRQNELQRLLAEEARRPFALTEGPLVRFGLIRLSQREHILSLNMHHIISDAWSMGVLLKELAQFYSAAQDGTDTSLEDLSIQYADFASWQREQFEAQSQLPDLNYWARQMEGPLPVLAFPTDHPRPPRQSFEGATKFFVIPKALSQGIQELTRKARVTQFMVLLAAFYALLKRYSRQEEIIIGSPISGRHRSETEGLIGMFVNTLPLRISAAGDPTFLDLVTRVRETTLGAYEHQEIPSEKLIELLRLDRQTSRHPLFQVVLGFQEDFARNWSLPGITASRIELESRTSKFDCTLLFTDTDEGLRLRFEYSTRLFEPETVDRFVRQFELLLAEILASPEKRLSQLNLWPDEERKELPGRNRTATCYERDKRIHEVFEKRVEETPHAVALSFQGKEISYEELNRRANQLARRLQKVGVNADVPVALCLERSPEMIVAMLAILKAGGAYVPLDRSYPSERIQFTLHDSGSKVVVTDSVCWKDHKEWVDGTFILLDADQEAIARESNGNLSTSGTSENLAYIIYTSGSTGLPKGTEIPHRGVVRLVRNTNYAEFSPQETFLQLATITFDASIFEIWGALLNAAKLVIFPPHPPTLEELGRTIQQERVSTLWLTAGLFHQMVDSQLDALKGVHQLLAGGEALSVPHVVRAAGELQNCQLINGYGPTENTTFTCCYQVPPKWAGGTSVPIGKPISNTQVYILDEHGQPAPVGIPGELWIGGDGLARGYLNQPELTAKCFVPDPFVTDGAASKLYRTGDLARWLPDGNIEFLGRIDEQLKIRGFRVEPGEIERVLAEHPLVRDAVVLAREDKSAAKHLVAYFVPKQGERTDPEALRGFLQAKLPAYMIPSWFLSLPELPLTKNGKIDKRSLPAPEDLQPNSPQNMEPRTDAEAGLLGIWCELLQTTQLSVTDNFFHIGGHSLLATQMISRILRAFGVELPVSAVFESPTIQALAELIVKSEPHAIRQSTGIRRRVRWESNKYLLQHLDELSDSQVEELLAKTD